MSDSTHDLLVRGIAAAKGNSREEARFYLEWVLRSPDAEPDEIVKASRSLAELSDDPAEERKLLEQALAYDPYDAEARRALAILNGTLKPADIVDPDRMPAPVVPETPLPIQARRFVCAQCGGRMAFEPDGKTLTCAYCGNRQSVIGAMDAGALLEEHDFAVALATAQGHSTPVATQSLKCHGCGASVILSAPTISTVCPYCATPYVIEQAETRALISPEGIVPSSVTQDQAQQAVLDWYRSQGFKVLSANALPAGVYLPAWTFDVSGEVTWNCLVEENDLWQPQSGSEVVYENDLRVAASHSLSAALTDEIDNFPLDRLVPFNPSYLADWLAETYQITVSGASLVARSRLLAKTQSQIQAGIAGTFKDLQLNPAHLVFESYKLVLVPLWIAHYRYEKVWRTVVVNGQQGTVRGEKPLKGVRKVLSGMLGGP